VFFAIVSRRCSRPGRAHRQHTAQLAENIYLAQGHRMISRRDILKRISTALTACLLGCFGWSNVHPRQRPRQERDAATLLRDIAELRGRNYSETGVSMIVACEDLTRDGVGLPNAWDTHIAAAFGYYTTLFLEAHPDASADDVAAIVEFIADRDFATGGRAFSL
jgi:hypothetical protein